VVIVGDEVVGPLESHEEAESAGYTRFGIGPLYVKRVLAESLSSRLPGPIATPCPPIQSII
jgi:hypothetical protein